MISRTVSEVVVLLDQLLQAEVVIGAMVIDKAQIGVERLLVGGRFGQKEQTTQVEAGLLMAGVEGKPALPDAVFAQRVVVDGQRKTAVGAQSGRRLLVQISEVMLALIGRQQHQPCWRKLTQALQTAQADCREKADGCRKAAGDRLSNRSSKSGSWE